MATNKKKTAKAEEAKVEEVKAVEEKAAEVKEEAAKTETVAKKTTAKKAAKAEEPVIKCTIEFQGKNTKVRSIVDNIFEVEGGKENVKTLDVYVQPENNIAYYVVNGVEEGKSVKF